MTNEKSTTTYEYTYTCLFEPEPEGGFTVTCPALPGLVTYGDTIEEARAMASEAIEVSLECLKAEGSPIPIGEGHTGATRREPITVKFSYSP